MTARTPKAITPRHRRLVAIVALLAALVAAATVGPAILAPSHTTQARAGTFSTCTVAGCPAARTARTGWQQRHFPTTRGWYSWSGGLSNFAGGQYHNFEGELPAGATYYEYDVFPRVMGAHRDAVRIIVDSGSGATWYSPNHYTDFYRLT